MLKKFAAAACLVLLAPVAAAAHPHVFIDAKLDVVAGPDGTIKDLKNTWRFDEVFSSSVIMDFDTNMDLKLGTEELKKLAETIRASLGEYDYFTFVTANGKQIAMVPPRVLTATYADSRLTVSFTMQPKAPLPLKGRLSFGIHDPTLYTSLDFKKDDDLTARGAGFTGCARKVVRPDADQVIAQNQTSLTDAFFNDPTGTDMSKLFATRLELTCK
ncbi:DUF1007 family protein [Rhizobium halophytocola]|uniref:ABC-type uncharacterized transport system substrate-binding protein n=1 Tax=Rhizobium halophytocola TaxID=735519 RepID=A0ABS4DTH6_9HYPH|nr:DUF1007 family protein [Rhizobium halophytocola]MBP1848988.1 ABC-type uncharacterized transport system substrate-binding protein [Rhizobium halophytocola]